MAKTQGEQILEAIISKGSGAAAAQASTELEAYKRGAKVSSVVSAMKPEFVDELSKNANQSIINIDKNIGQIRQDQKVILGETKQNNKLLKSLLDSSSKYYENNNELIKNLLLSKTLSEEKMLGGEARSFRRAASVSAEPIVPSTGKPPEGEGISVGRLASGFGLGGLDASKFAGGEPDRSGGKGGRKTSVEEPKVKITQEEPDRSGGKKARGEKISRPSIIEGEPERSGSKKARIQPDIGSIKPAEIEPERSGGKGGRIQPTIQGKPQFIETPESKMFSQDEISRLQKKAQNLKIEPTFTPAGKVAGDVAEGVGQSATKEVIEESVAKAVGKKGLGVVAKALPFVGAAFGIYDTLMRASSGDWVGAGMAAGSAALSFGGPVSFAGAAGLDLTNIARDAYKNAYGIFPEDDPLKGQRMQEIAAATQEYIVNEMKKLGKPTYPPEGNDKASSGGPISGGAVNMGAGGQGIRNLAPAPVTPITKIPESRVDGISQPSSGGTAVIRQGDTINNITNNSSSGGGGTVGAVGSTPTAPKNPWDEPLYGQYGISLF